MTRSAARRRSLTDRLMDAFSDGTVAAAAALWRWRNWIVWPAIGFVGVIDLGLLLLPPVEPRSVVVEVPALPAPLVSALRVEAAL
jgi:hypothetical protein